MNEGTGVQGRARAGMAVRTLPRRETAGTL